VLQAGAEIDETSDGGRTALHAAASTSREHVIKFLAGKGADVTIKGDDGKTAQAIAEGNQAVNIVRLLKAAKDKQSKQSKAQPGGATDAPKDETKAPAAAAPVLIELDGAALRAGSLDARKPAVIRNFAKMADGSAWPAFEA
jgi:ankyrin repeat protein